MVAEDQLMDSIGAPHLAARLRAGVRVGTTIVLDSDRDAGASPAAPGAVRRVNG